MKNDKKQENLQEDKRALVKFVLLMVAAMFLGGAAGVGMTALRMSTSGKDWAGGLEEFGKYFCVGGIYFVSAVTLIVTAVLYRQSRRLYRCCQEEEEELLTQIERKLSYGIWLSGLCLILCYGLFAVGAYLLVFQEKVFEGGEMDVFSFLLILSGFLISIVISIVSQRALVNLEKELNPEKSGSVFDTKFQTKWLETCDEGERLIIYKSAYQSYRVMNRAYSIAFIVSMAGMACLKMDFWPALFVTALWAIQSTVYCFRSMDYQKHPSEVMK